jgi:ABC-type amino acid transport system permease subunit
MQEFLDRVLARFGQQSDTRRAAILGIIFGLLLCVVFVLVALVIGFIATLGG